MIAVTIGGHFRAHWSGRDFYQDVSVFDARIGAVYPGALALTGDSYNLHAPLRSINPNFGAGVGPPKLKQIQASTRGSDP